MTKSPKSDNGFTHQYRGLYLRVAKKTGIHPTHVSRIARGVRHNPAIEKALVDEAKLMDIESGRVNSNNGDSKIVRLRVFIKMDLPWVRQEWLNQCLAHPELSRIKMAPQKRTAPIQPLVTETMRSMRLAAQEVDVEVFPIANHYGNLRREEGFTLQALLDEYRVLWRCLFGLARKHYVQMEHTMWAHDVGQMSDVWHRQLQRSTISYLK